jgi:DNA-binding CsgD family transcriptional regulator
MAVAARSQSITTRVLEAGLDALSLLHIGLVVCNAAGSVLEANRAVAEILKSRDGLEISPEGTLCATQAGGQSIPEIVQQVARRPYAERLGSSGTALAVPRGARRRPLTLFLHAIGTDCAEGEAAAIVLVMILDSALPVRAIETELRQLYGFTSTEARLANLLMEGRALDDCCSELGICRSTGCTHLRRLFKKTGVHRQSELVGLLLKSIGLACLGAERTADL